MFTRLLFPTAVTLVFLLMETGCQTIHSRTAQDASLSEVAKASGAAIPTITVEVREGFSQKSRTKQLALTEPLSVQQLLKKTGVLGEFRRMNISIERPIAGQRVPLRLAIPFDPGTHSVVAGRDYAVLPGDKVIIAEDKRTMVDRVLEKALDSLGPFRPIAE